MHIVIVEPFFTGSHKEWATEYAKYSQHQVTLLTQEGRYWKWRMHGGAVTLANELNQSDVKPDLILASDMLDLSLFLSLTRQKYSGVKAFLYFHENQLNYPWSPTDQDVKLKRDNHYAFINFTSALSADSVLFNSKYHQEAFLNELPLFLKQFPDYQEIWSVGAIREKSQVLALGLDLKRFDACRVPPNHESKPLLLWNHRWEYDKNPESFFKALFQLSDEGHDFDLAVLGEHYRKYPAIFDEAKTHLAKHIVQWGYVSSFEEYAQWLWRADILPVTSVHDFFGISVVQGMYCQCMPLVPNRMAYPEHLPINTDLIYHTEKEFVDKLREAIVAKTYQHIDVSHKVEQYDWSILAPKYDRLFQGYFD